MRRVTITIGWNETDPDLDPYWIPRSALLEGYSVKLEADDQVLGASVAMTWKEASEAARAWLNGGDLPRNEEEEENEA